MSSVQKMMRRPSGDHAGWNPKSESRRAGSPVAPPTKIPPRPLPTWKAMLEESGENAAPPSEMLGSAAMGIGVRPPTRCMKMSVRKNPRVNAIDVPSGERAGSDSTPASSVICWKVSVGDALGVEVAEAGQ